MMLQQRVSSGFGQLTLDGHAFERLGNLVPGLCDLSVLRKTEKQVVDPL